MISSQIDLLDRHKRMSEDKIGVKTRTKAVSLALIFVWDVKNGTNMGRFKII